MRAIVRTTDPKGTDINDITDAAEAIELYHQCLFKVQFNADMIAQSITRELGKAFNI